MLDLAKKLEEFTAQIKEQPKSVNDKVLVVDALNSYIRCFSAVPTMNDDGEHVGGVSGFLKSVGLAIRQINPSKVVLVFDGKGGSKKRREVFSEYKDNRKPSNRLNRTYNFTDKAHEQQSMQWQLHLLVELCGHLPVITMAIPNIEADDTIAYIANTLTEQKNSCVIMSTDKDFLQLVNEHCSVYNPIKKKMYRVESVVEEYGVHPNNFMIFRTLVGDKSDNIDGIKGVGLSTVKKIVPEISHEKHISHKLLFERCRASTSKTAHRISDQEDKVYRNDKLMNLKELDLSSSIRMNILEQFNRSIPRLDKPGLTKLCSQHKLLSAFGHYDEWIMSTWLRLTRFSQKEPA